MNQYSYLVPCEIYSEYKVCDSKRKREILNTVFTLIRNVNTFPVNEITFEKELQTLRTLITLDVNSLYKNGVISSSNAGLTLLKKYFPNIYDVRKTFLWKTHPISLTMREAFYSDKHLKQALKANLQYDNDASTILSWLGLAKVGYVNNFKPSVAKVIYDTNLKPNSKVFDYAMGYGGRMLGAWAADNVIEYVAVDPNTETYNNGISFADFLKKNYYNLKIEIYQDCSEDFSISRYPNYKNYFDMAFSSPQYFNVEIYSDEPTQSCHKFPDYNNWVKGFLRPTIHNCINILKPDGIFAINMSIDTEVRLKNIGKIIKFICSEKDFYLYKVDKMLIQVRPGNGPRDRKKGKYEPIWYFKHRDYIKL